MQEFFEIAKTDFLATFEGAWIFWLLLCGVVWILVKEKDWIRKLLTGVLPAMFLFLYWCPVSGILFMKVLGENVYWRILWLILLAVTIPYAMCLALGELQGVKRQGAFLLCLGILAVGGKKVLSEEWFEPSTNVYKLPQNVIEVCELLPGNVHVMVSNRLMPYIRQCDPTITSEFGRNSLAYNGKEDSEEEGEKLYLEAQKEEIDLAVLGVLARKEGCTFLVFSNNRTYLGDWADYGYREYGRTDEFVIYVDEDYKEGQDTRKWIE